MKIPIVVHTYASVTHRCELSTNQEPKFSSLDPNTVWRQWTRLSHTNHPLDDDWTSDSSNSIIRRNHCLQEFPYSNALRYLSVNDPWHCDCVSLFVGITGTYIMVYVLTMYVAVVRATIPIASTKPPPWRHTQAQRLKHAIRDRIKNRHYC